MWNSVLAVGQVSRSVRSTQRFRFGTCLTTSAASLLICALPANAAPASLLTLNTIALPQPVAVPVTTTLPFDLTVRRETAATRPTSPIVATGLSVTGGTKAGARATSVALRDPTIVPSAKRAAIITGGDVAVRPGDVSTTADYDHGVGTFATGTTMIEANDITTSGMRAAGVHAVGYGDIAVTTGDVATSGYLATGIYANTNLSGANGGIAVSAGNVSTTGDRSTGIYAGAYHGAVNIDVGSVRTSGYGSGGINVWSYDHDATVKVGSVVTTGDGGRGISAYTGGSTTVVAGDVATAGTGTSRDSGAAGIIAVGAAVNVQAGNVSTQGNYSAGIYAVSNRVHDNGQDNRDITVSAGTVTTHGNQSDGIDAINYSLSRTSVAADHVSTAGEASWGIYAAGLGDVAVKAGSVETSGANAAGIAVTSVNGAIDVDVGTVATHGDSSNAINAINYSQYGATSIKVGTLSTEGAGSAGIYVGGSNSYQGASRVVTVSAGSITTKGDLAAGLVVLTGGNVDIDVGDVTIEGPRARGIIVNTSGGDINLNAGSIVTKGAVALGRDAVGLAVSNSYGNINADVQSITTAGDHSPGILANGLHSNQSFVVHDGITTTGEHSSGMFAYLSGGVLSLDSGAIATSGADSSGVSAYVTDGDIAIHVGRLTTLGDNSNGLSIQASSFGGLHTTSLGVDAVETSGAYSSGILVNAQGGNVSVGGNTITTSGANSAGIAIAAGHGVDADGNVYGGNVAIDVKSVATSGEGANGIDTVATRSTAINAGSVTTVGAGSDAIHAIGNGSLTLDVGSIATTGAHSTGIYAVTDLGDVSIKAASVDTAGLLSHGIRAASYSGNVTVDAGTVTGGVGTGIDVRAGYGDHGNATVTAGSIVTSGAGIVAFAGDDVTVKAGSVVTHSGMDDAGTQLGQAIKAIGHGTVDISAASIATTGYWAEGIYAVTTSSDTGQQPGDLTIDVGSVSTAGAKSTGIYAVDTGFQTGGSQKVSITAGPVSTLGDYATGIYGVGPNVTITANGPVSTAGNQATGIYAGAIGGAATITAGDVSTLGDFAAGVRGFGSLGTVDITTSGAISTAGENSYGVLAFGSADLTVNNSGSIKTSGGFARGVYELSRTGLATVTNSGTIATSGASAEGIRVISLADGVEVRSTGSISTTGDYSAGIIAGRDQSGRGDKAGAVSDVPVGTVTVKADAISTTGLHSNGVVAVNYSFGGSTSVDVGSVTTSGAGAAGVAAVTFGDLAINAGAISSSGNAIYAVSSGADSQSISVSGSAISTGDTAIVAVSSFGNSVINVGKGAKVIGAGHRDPVYVGHGDGVQIDVYLGTGTINNAGTIATAGDGYAIEATGGLDYYGNASSHIVVNNSGTILGAIKLAAGADVVTNSGVFVATKDSDFGGGGDSFVNSGTLVVAPNAKPGTIAFDSLATFKNDGGLIDLRNGVAGDVLKLSGTFVGSGASSLALDLIGGKADRLEVTGAATGHTNIALTMSAADARLLAAPVTLVKGGAGSAADAFSITNADVGLLHFGVRYDSASGTYGLTSAAGAPVYRTLNIPRAAQATWLRAEDAWDAHMNEKRDARLAGGDGFGQRLWGQLYGGVTAQDGARGLDGTRIKTGYRQDYYGGQVGFDLAGKATDKGGMLFGVTGSYISSHLNGRGSTDRSQLGSVELGAYASFLSGPLFANVLGQYGHDRISTRNTTLGYKDRLNGDSFGAAAQVGVHLGTDRLYVEPMATLSYVSTDIGNLRALDQTVDFDKRDGLRGKFGGRIGSAIDMKGGGKAVLYVNGAYIHEFEGKAGLDFLSGGVVQHVVGVAPVDYGRAAFGVNILSAGRASGFIEGDTDFGGGTSGGGGRVGISFKL